MGAFLLFYQFLLERENMHVFKRFFLLSALVASLAIPTLVFTEYVEMTPAAENQTRLLETAAETAIATTEVSDLEVVNWELLFMSIYGLGLLFFGFRFIKHLVQIGLRVQKNPRLKLGSYTRVLLGEKMPPHTFFKYIFLNKLDIEKKNIPDEVILHEETHAKQLHSIDVLFIELLQVLLWFNPLIYLFQRNIKLNHEFLADSAVLKKNVPTRNYQNTLLSYLSMESNQKYQSVKMANAINYSSIKKRFSIMKKRTSKKSIALRSLLLIPVTSLLLFGFSTKRVIPKISDKDTEKTHYTARSLSIEILDNNAYLIEGQAADKKNFEAVINSFNKDISPEIRNNILNVHLNSSKEISNAEVWFIYNSFLEYGFYRIVAPNQEIIRPKGNKPFAIEDEQPTITAVSENKQESATREQLREYNALARKYNEMDRSQMRIQMKEVEKLKYIYSIMSAKQRADAEPFPDFPKPPPPPESPKVLKGEASSNPPPPPPPPASKSPRVLKGEASAVPPPPPPPTPPNPLDHVIDMAKKGAEFYYEGKKISSDRAIELLKKNKSLNIDSRSKNSKKPIVRISKEPIKIGRVDTPSQSLYDYAKELETQKANFYLDGEPIPSGLALYIIQQKDYDKVETLPWTNKTPEVKIYSKA